VGVVSWICHGGMGWCDRWQREALDFCGATIRAGLVELRRIELEGAAALWQRCGGVSCSEEKQRERKEQRDIERRESWS
jgi:hypothetical protein